MPEQKAVLPLYFYDFDGGDKRMDSSPEAISTVPLSNFKRVSG